MRTQEGKALILSLTLGQWVSRAELYAMFGGQAEFRRQVAEFRPEMVPHLGAKCTRRGIEVRADARVVEVGEHCRATIGRMAASQAVKVASVDPSKLNDEQRRQGERAVGFFSTVAAASLNKELRGDIGSRLLGAKRSG